MFGTHRSSLSLNAIQAPVAVDDGQTKEVTFILGVGRDADDARNLVHRFRGVPNAHRALEGVWHYWSRALGAVYFETPDPAVNFLANGWLVYQTLACRMWARTGYYQSGASGTVGGAFVYTQPFTAQQGDANVVASVTATLSNSQGTSQPRTAP